MERIAALIGFLVIIAIAWALSNNKRRVNLKTFGWGLGLQFAFAVMVLRGASIEHALEPLLPGDAKVYYGLAAALLVALVAWGRTLPAAAPGAPTPAPPGAFSAFQTVTLLVLLVVSLRFNLLEHFFVEARELVTKIIDFAAEGGGFVFGNLVKGSNPVGFVFAFGVLPTIIFVASLFAIMYYLGIMQVIVRFFARLFSRFLATSGAESTSVAASIFMGQTEAPLTIRPFLSGMTMSELMTMMTAGMAHVSGGIMAAYVLVAHVDIKHLLAAVIMTAPGSIFMSKLMVPEVDTPATGPDVEVDIPNHDVNIIDAAARGAAEGGNLALNVAYMLVAFIALIALVNGLFSFVHSHVAAFPESLQALFAIVLKPLAFIMGVRWEDAGLIGSLMGERMVINEFVAFIDLGKLRATTDIDFRSFTIATYALCGFANFSSVAIQIGGIGALAPDRRHDLARLGIRAMIAGTLANYLTATIAGMLLTAPLPPTVHVNGTDVTSQVRPIAVTGVATINVSVVASQLGLEVTLVEGEVRVRTADGTEWKGKLLEESIVSGKETLPLTAPIRLRDANGAPVQPSEAGTREAVVYLPVDFVAKAAKAEMKVDESTGRIDLVKAASTEPAAVAPVDATTAAPSGAPSTSPTP